MSRPLPKIPKIPTRRPPPVQLLPKQVVPVPNGALVHARFSNAAELMMLRAGVSIDEVTRRTGVPTEVVRDLLKQNKRKKYPKIRLDVAEAIETACGDRFRFGVESIDHPSRSPRSLIEEENQKLMLLNGLLERKAKEALEQVASQLEERSRVALEAETKLSSRISELESLLSESEASAEKARRSKSEIEIENARLLEEVDRLTRRADLYARNLRALNYKI